MKRIAINISLAAVIIVIAISSSCRADKKKKDDQFTFVFMTDIHLTPQRNAVTGLKKAMQVVNDLNPDFVITGGDLIMDALAQRHSLADSLYNLYIETIKELKTPVYNTMGNHEIYGIYSRSGADPAHPDYGEKMFESRIGKSYYSFEYKGWKFMILNSVEDTRKSRYVGKIDEAQIEWIKSELINTEKTTPVVISTHIPFLTVFSQAYDGSTVANDSSLVVYNAKEVLDLFKDHNLKLVLQGHLHTVEEIYVDGIHFVTGGAISGGWWQGPNKGFEEGFMLITAKGGEVECRYIDYGWEAAEEL